MSRTLTASDRSALIRLASTMEKGSEERRAILAALSNHWADQWAYDAVNDWMEELENEARKVGWKLDWDFKSLESDRRDRKSQALVKMDVVLTTPEGRHPFKDFELVASGEFSGPSREIQSSEVWVDWIYAPTANISDMDTDVKNLKRYIGRWVEEYAER